MSEADIILLEKYFDNQLDAEEKALFEQKKADPIFAEALQSREKMDHFLAYKSNTGIKIEDILKLNKKHFAKEEANLKKDNTTIIQWITKNRRPIAIAATILFLVIAAALLLPYLSPQKSPEQLYATYAIHQPIESTRSSEELCSDFVSIQESFNVAQYTIALAAINTCLIESPENLELQLYKGISLLETGQSEEALALFQRLAAGESLLKNEGLWYAALSNLKSGNLEASIRSLSAIPTQSSRYAIAQKLIKELSK